MSSFTKLVYTRKTKSGFTEELHLSCRRYMEAGKKWSIEQYGIFGKVSSTHLTDIAAAKDALREFNAN